MSELNDGGSRIECLLVGIRERPTGRYPGGNLLESTTQDGEADEIPCKQLGRVSQLLAVVLLGQECLGCVWSEWKRTSLLSW